MSLDIAHLIQTSSQVRRAFTHASAGEEHYERLEFLGDAVLQFLITEILFDRHPEMQEGELTKRRSALVRGETLAAVALHEGLDRFVVWGAREEISAEEPRRRILSCVLEALVGAVYREQGLEVVRNFVSQAFAPWIEERIPLARDFKTELQELIQKEESVTPAYELLERIGEPHDSVFRVRVFWVCSRRSGETIEFRGEGKSRKKAEESAAQVALQNLKAEEK